MDRLHGAVRIRGQDDEMLAIAVVPAASRHEQRFPALLLKSIFCLGFVPLIEGRCRDCNAPVPDAVTEERFLGGGLAPGIEHQALFLPLLHGEAPPEPDAGQSAVFCQKDRGFLRWMDVGAADALYGGGRSPAELFVCLPYQLLDFFSRIIVYVITSINPISE